MAGSITIFVEEMICLKRRVSNPLTYLKIGTTIVGLVFQIWIIIVLNFVLCCFLKYFLWLNSVFQTDMNSIFFTGAGSIWLCIFTHWYKIWSQILIVVSWAKHQKNTIIWDKDQWQMTSYIHTVLGVFHRDVVDKKRHTMLGRAAVVVALCCSLMPHHMLAFIWSWVKWSRYSN